MKSNEELALALVADSVSRLIGAWNISKFSGNGWLSCKLNGGDLRIEEGSVVFWNMERVEEAWVLCHLMDSELAVRMPDMPSELYQEVCRHGAGLAPIMHRQSPWARLLYMGSMVGLPRLLEVPEEDVLEMGKMVRLMGELGRTSMWTVGTDELMHYISTRMIRRLEASGSPNHRALQPWPWGPVADLVPYYVHDVKRICERSSARMVRPWTSGEVPLEYTTACELALRGRGMSGSMSLCAPGLGMLENPPTLKEVYDRVMNQVMDEVMKGVGAVRATKTDAEWLAEIGFPASLKSDKEV